MISKVTALAVLSALAEQASAAHHVQHRHLHERDVIVETDTTTVWETVTVYIGADGKATPAANEAGNAPANPAPTSVATTSVVVDQTPENNAAAPTTLSSVIKEQPVVQSTTTSAAAPPTTTSAAPATTQPSTGGNNGSGSSWKPSSKRGIAYDDPALAVTLKEGCKGCGWTYNWNSIPKDDALNNGIQFIPTLKKATADGNADWPGLFDANANANFPVLFSFNEPDRADQADILPEPAAAAHAKHFQKYIGKVSISSPAISSSAHQDNAVVGLDWLEQFATACAATDGCHYDFCNIHWYGTVDQEQALFDHIDDAYTKCGKGALWITELGLSSGSASDAATFISSVGSKLDSNEKVAAWAWFMTGNTGETYLFGNGGNAISSAGSAYAS